MLYEVYVDSARKAMVESFGYANVMEIPKIIKVCVNVGLGVADNKVIDNVLYNLAAITGQKPVVTKARKSISGFKLRSGQKVGCKVTLRGQIMYHFLERSLYFAFPRGRDFKGFHKSQFDGRGNLNIAVREHTVFPEVDYSKVEKVFGMDINVVTTAKTDEEAKFLLALLDFPFRD